jgi:Ca-activated chloride channel family protein
MIMNWRSKEGKSQDVRMPAPQFYSNVYRALEDAVSKFKNEKARKGIVVMTDGRDTPALEEMLRKKSIPELETDGAFRKVVQNLKKQEIPIYFIALNTDRNPSPSVNGQEAMRIAAAMGPPAAEKYVESVRRRMEHIAEVTGGRILFPRTLADVVPLYLAIGAELGASYGLSYAPSNPVKDGKFRRIEVRVRKEGVKVTQSRDGYPAN